MAHGNDYGTGACATENEQSSLVPRDLVHSSFLVVGLSVCGAELVMC